MAGAPSSFPEALRRRERTKKSESFLSKLARGASDPGPRSPAPALVRTPAAGKAAVDGRLSCRRAEYRAGGVFDQQQEIWEPDMEQEGGRGLLPSMVSLVPASSSEVGTGAKWRIAARASTTRPRPAACRWHCGEVDVGHCEAHPPTGCTSQAHFFRSSPGNLLVFSSDVLGRSAKEARHVAAAEFIFGLTASRREAAAVVARHSSGRQARNCGQGGVHGGSAGRNQVLAEEGPDD